MTAIILSWWCIRICIVIHPTDPKASSKWHLFHKIYCKRQKNNHSISIFYLDLCFYLENLFSNLCLKLPVSLLPLLEFIFSCRKKLPKATISSVYMFSLLEWFLSSGFLSQREKKINELASVIHINIWPEMYGEGCIECDNETMQWLFTVGWLKVVCL